ncbi:hypothetical protein FOCC_FOCC006303 [Frankliniella occidentalis]|nr:hypothetical protein FOCC_FOCC006303 [Frankliniella occidentalis]
MSHGVFTSCPVEGCPKKYKNIQTFTGHMTKKHKNTSSSSQVLPQLAVVTQPAILENSVDISSTAFGDFDNDCGTEHECFDDISSDRFLETMCQFYMKLEYELMLPASTVQYIAKELSVLHSGNNNLIEKRLKRKLQHCKIKNVDEIVSYVMADNPLKKIQNELKTTYLRKETYKRHFSYVNPQRMPIHKGPYSKHFYFVPIKETVKALFSDKSISFKLSPPQFSQIEDLLLDYTDGYVFKENAFFISNPLGLHFILYQDALEIVVPIGPAKKKYKLLAVYLIIGNIPAHLRSRISTIQLVALCIEKYFNHEEFYGPIVKDLKGIETVGVDIPGVGTVKGSLVCIVGDNLGSHGLGGFVEQFSTSLYFCRFCLIKRKDFHKAGGELATFAPRTVDSYDNSLTRLAESRKKVYRGIKFDSIFNELTYFHVCRGLPPCLAHDLHEGCVTFDMKIFIDYFVDKEWFTFESLTKSLEDFNFSVKDKRDRPIPVLESHTRVKGGAWQICVFLRLFPLLVKNFILDENDPVWRAMLLLIEIVEIVLSPSIHRSYLPYLHQCITDYLHQRKTLFPEIQLRPKHHYLSHYSELTEAFGPLIRVFTLRFESKHTFFKRCIRAFRNFINPTLSLSVRHELYQAYRRSGADRHCKVNVMGDSDSFLQNYSDEIKREISSKHLSAGINECVSAEVLGTIYKKGNIVAIRQTTYQYEVEIGRILLVLYDNKDGVYLLLEKLATEFIPHLRVYEVGCKISYECISVCELMSTQSLHVYPSGSHLYVKLHHALVSDELD